MKKILIILFLAVGMAACNETPVIENPNKSTTVEMLAKADTAVVSEFEDKIYVIENGVAVRRYYVEDAWHLFVLLAVGIFIGIGIGSMIFND